MPKNAVIVVDALKSPSPANWIMLDRDNVYVADYHAVYSAPRSGGTATKVYPPVGETKDYVMFWPRGNELMVRRYDEAGPRLDVVEKGGGPIIRSVTIPEYSGGPFVATTTLGTSYDSAADAVYGVNGPRTNDPSEPAIFWSYDVAKDTQRVLANTPLGSRDMAAGGSYMVTQKARSRDEAATFYRIPVSGGMPEEIPMIGSFYDAYIVIADGSDVFFNARSESATIKLADGIYRLPMEGGGSPERVIDELGVLWHAVGDDNRLIFAGVSDVYAVPHHSGSARKLFEAGPGSGCILSAIGLDGDDVFLVLYEGEDTIRVVRIPAP